MNRPVSGLRELKKQRTRAALIDVAARLCVERGYDNTTVEQIAADADISPRTFSRYFPNKEAVMVAIIGEVADTVAATVAVSRSTSPNTRRWLARHLQTFRRRGRRT